MNDTIRKASPRKLRSGEWGVQADMEIEIGDIVQVTTRAGKTWQAQISRIDQFGPNYAICATISPANAAPVKDTPAPKNDCTCNPNHKNPIFRTCGNCLIAESRAAEEDAPAPSRPATPTSDRPGPRCPDCGNRQIRRAGGGLYCGECMGSDYR